MVYMSLAIIAHLGGAAPKLNPRILAPEGAIYQRRVHLQNVVTSLGTRPSLSVCHFKPNQTVIVSLSGCHVSFTALLSLLSSLNFAGLSIVYL